MVNITKRKDLERVYQIKHLQCFLTILDNKLKWNEKQLIKIDTWNVKASQYNHFDDNYVKKELGERWNDFGEFKIQRFIYSAFLIMNVKDSLKEVDREKQMF